MIAFNEIPNTFEVPGTYAEFNNRLASQAGDFTHPVLMIGQLTSAGTATAGVLVEVGSANDADILFGVGSHLAGMVRLFRQNAPYIKLVVLPLADLPGGTQATGTLTVAGTATTAGTLGFFINGKLLQAGVAVGNTPTQIATTIAAVINADTSLPVTAASAVGVVTLTAKHKGLIGNDIKLSTSRWDVPAFPTVGGVTLTAVTLASGTGDPDLATALAPLPELYFGTVINPYKATIPIGAVKDWLTTRWTATMQLDGMAIQFRGGSYSTALTFAGTVNDPFAVFAYANNSPNADYEITAALAGQVATAIENHSARPLQRLSIKGIIAPAGADRFDQAERNQLYLAGLGSFIVNEAGQLVIDKLPTSYLTNNAGASDSSYHESEDLYNLSYVRRWFNRFLENTYISQRFTLANNDDPIGLGQFITTPNMIKDALCAEAKKLVERGNLRNYQRFVQDIVVEIDVNNSSRINYILPVTNPGQLRLTAGSILFIN